MKTLIVALSSLLFTTITVCQNQIEIIKIKNKDNSVVVSAKNRSMETYEISVDITLIGMIADTEFPAVIILNPNESKQIATLVPEKGALDRTYKIHYRAEPEDRANTILAYDVIEPNITIYTKNSQTESTYLIKYLKRKGIPFLEVNVDYNDETMRRYTDMLTRRGLKSKEVKLPVVINRGEINYNIKDIEEFCSKKFKTDSK